VAAPGGSAFGGQAGLLQQFRLVHGAVMATDVLLAVVVLLVLDLGPVEADPVASGALTLAAIATAAGVRIGRRPLPTDGDATMAFRTRMFVSIAVLNTGALIGFVAAFLVEAAWPYLVAAVLSLIGFALTAPTEARVRAEQQDLQRRGSTSDLFGMGGGVGGGSFTG
jgi:hypothetical protein